MSAPVTSDPVLDMVLNGLPPSDTLRVSPPCYPCPAWKAQHSRTAFGDDIFTMCRLDQPEMFPVELTFEHLVMAGSICVTDRVRLLGPRCEDLLVGTVVSVPGADRWADRAAQVTIRYQTGLSEGPRDEIEARLGSRGFSVWGVWDTVEGWVPLTLVAERLVTAHRVRDGGAGGGAGGGC